MSDYLSSIYMQYKNDTFAFTTWPRTAADACGYNAKPKTKLSELLPNNGFAQNSPAQPTPQPQLKGRARKAAKEANAANARYSRAPEALP